MNNDDNETDEINFHYTSEENNNNTSNDNNNTDENNDNNDNNENIEDKNDFIINEISEFSDNEINSKINSDEIIEESNKNEQEEELPLITLNFISICQCCKNKFDNKNNIPYLFKCGHFFCINCIKQYFTEEKGIICPSDGIVAKSINDLKILKNVIIDSKKITKKNVKKIKNIYENIEPLTIHYQKNKDSNNNYISNYCHIHRNQKLSHIVISTNEIICVHCAFERLKSNPNLEIKEIKEKCNEFNENIENIINNSQKNIELIQHTLELINKNKENELKKIKIFYKNIIKYIESLKKEKIEQIENIYEENTHDLEQKLLIFNEIMEQGEELQKILGKENEDINQNYSKILNNYNSLLKLNKSNNDDTINN